jgi:DNA end-binding protein Ku
MKSVWKGYIQLGQLGVPVRLFTATQDPGVKFVQLHETDSSPVERPLFCKKERKEIPVSETIRGVEVEPGKYITFTDQELERNDQSAAKAIEITQFCEQAQIAPAYYEKPYYIVPTRGGEYGYALLREGLARTATSALGRFYYYGNDYLGMIETSEDILMLHHLRYADEIIPRTDAPMLPLPRVQPAEIESLSAIIQRYAAPVHLRDYHNQHEERIKLLCERKAKGLPMPKPERVPPGTTQPEELLGILREMNKSNAPQIAKE